MGGELDRGTLDADEQALVARVEQRRDDLVALACELIGFDTTSRSSNEDAPREEAALQQSLGDRLAAAGADVDLWEPSPEDAADHPLSVVGRGACDMKGGIAAMVLAAEVLAEQGGLAGDVLVCTNTDEESSGVGGLACARHGVSADFAIVTEPSGLEVWPACRGTVYCTIGVPGRAGHAEQEHPHWREGGAVNAVDLGRFLLDGVDRLRREWRNPADLRPPPLHPA